MIGEEHARLIAYLSFLARWKDERLAKRIAAERSFRPDHPSPPVTDVFWLDPRPVLVFLLSSTHANQRHEPRSQPPCLVRQQGFSRPTFAMFGLP